MMFPHRVTVIHKINDSYVSEVVEGVYWYGNSQRNKDGKGVSSGNSITIIAPVILEDKFVLGDYVLFGEYYFDIQSIAELEGYQYVTITNKSINSVGSAIDNVSVSCA